MPPHKTAVLIIEDDPSTAELYTWKLRLDGFRVDVARDAATAHLIFERTTPDIVCVDYRLPDAAGTSLVEFLSSRGAAVVLLSNDDDAVMTPPAGVKASLLKSRTSPGELSRLLRRLANALPDPAR